MCNGVDCPYTDKCSSHPDKCQTCCHNKTRKKDYYCPDHGQPCYPYYPWYWTITFDTAGTNYHPTWTCDGGTHTTYNISTNTDQEHNWEHRNCFT